MAKSFLLILLALVGLVRCQLGQESRILNNGGATRNQPPVLMRGGPTSGDLRNLQVRAIFLMTMLMMKADTSSSSFDQVFEDTPVGTTVYTLIGQVRLPCSLLISSESIKASSQPFSVSHPSILFSFGFLKTLHHFNHNHNHQPHSGSGGFSAALHDQRGLFQRQPKFWRSHSYQGVAHYHLLIMHIIMH